MDKPTCRLCGSRHWGSCTEYAEKLGPASREMFLRRLNPVSEASRKSMEQTTERFGETLKNLAAGPPPSPVSETHPAAAPTGHAPPGQCPYCDANRARNAARLRKHRSRP